MPTPLQFGVVLVLAYLVGSLPTSVWTCRVLKGIDIRSFGSGNAGATNVARVMGMKVAVFVGIIDTLKGVAVILITRKITGGTSEIAEMAGGLAAILGHVYTVFAGFKGGKGILVSLGVFVTLIPLPALSSLAVWGIVLYFSRYVSLSSILGPLLLPAFTYFYTWLELAHAGVPLQVFTFILPVIVIFTHRSNIVRLYNGTERKIGRKKENI